MLTLERNKMLQNLVGLGGYDEEETPLATRRIVVMTILMGSSLVTCSINLYFFIGNVKVATELMFCAAIYVIVFCSFFTVIQNRSTVRGFLFEIQKRVDESEWISTWFFESVNFNSSKIISSFSLKFAKGMLLVVITFIRKPKKWFTK